MLSTSLPPKFPIAWGANANSQYIRSIPQNSQIGIQNGAASLNDGFPPLTFTPESVGGVPPFGQDFNGILNEVTKALQWTQGGGTWPYDATFAGNIGGYWLGAIVESAILPGRFWYSTVDNNLQNPDAYPFTGWIALPGTNPAGTPMPSFSMTVLPNCVLANGLTIGNTGSGGSTAPTSLASPIAFFLFCAIWLQFPQTLCPTQFNGAAVARGANPSVDWLAGRVIQLPWMSGAGLIGQDNMGSRASSNLNGVPVQSGSLNTPGSIIGENQVSLTSPSQVPNGITSTGVNAISVNGITAQNLGFSYATVGLTGGGGVFVNSPTGISTVAVASSGNNTINVTSNNGGSSGHDNVERSFTCAWNLVL